MKIASIILCFMIVLPTFIMMMDTTDATFFINDALNKSNSGYIKTDGMGVETVYTESQVIHVCGNAGNINEGFLTFNTGDVGLDMTVISASINIFYLVRYTSPMLDPPIYITKEDYGLDLTNADSPAAVLYPDNTLMVRASTPYGWQNAIINTSFINKSGMSQFLIHTTNIADMQFYNNATSYMPYLTIDVLPAYGAIMTYNFTSAGMVNYSVNTQPVEIIDQGAKDLYRYEFWSSNQTITQIALSSVNYTFVSINPFATTTTPSTAIWNFTDLVPNAFYWVWFSLNKTISCDARISLYREATGDGVDFNTWTTYINTGSFTINTTMERVWEMQITLQIGVVYTISIFDYFPTQNFITKYTFVANNTVQYIDIPIPYAPLNFKSYRTDFTAFRIWYNGNLSYSPFQDHIPPDEWYAMSVRGGHFMIAVDYMTTTINGTATIDSTNFLNITVNSSVAYSIKISNSTIQTIITTVSGVSTTVNSILTGLMPSQVNIYYLLPGVPVGGTRSGLTASELAYVWRHPYKITEATVNDNDTGTAQSFINQRPIGGVVTWNSDKLFITGSNSARIFINSSGSSLINFTSNPGIVDLASFNVGNFTLWSNVTLNCHRISEFRQVELFYWAYYPDTLKYSISQKINNTLTGQWTDIYWFVGFATNNDGDIETAATDSIYVWDIDNSIKMDVGKNFDVTQGGICMHFDYINSSVSRQLQFTYWLENATSVPQSTPIINIRTYAVESYNGQNMYAGSGRWINNRTAAYTGDISISLKNLDGEIDSTSVVVFDNANNRLVFDEYYSVSGSTITINSDGTGTVGSGEARDYTIYFLYDETNVEPFFLFESSWRIGWIQINAHLLLFMAAIFSAGYGTVELITARKQKEESKGFGWILIGTMLMLIFVLTWILHSTGVL